MLLRPQSTTPTSTPTRAIPRENPRDEIARVGRKDVGVSGESVSVSRNAAFREDGEVEFGDYGDDFED